MRVCFATHNENKLKEVRFMLPNIDLVGLQDIGQIDEIEETGATLNENSLLKAEFIWNKFGVNCFADDTGLEVEALDGAPGVITARYAGNERDNDANINLLLSNLKPHENRNARFRTVITLIVDGHYEIFEGIVDGEITTSLTGHKGFGYDPVFMPKGYDKTFAEMTMVQKNEISHRGRAIKKLTEYLKNQ